jgi:hypothetical protein
MENNNNSNINRLDNDFDKLQISLNQIDYLTTLGINRKLDFQNSNNSINNNINNYQNFENNIINGPTTGAAGIDVDTLFKDEFNDQNHINFNYRNDINNISILSSANDENLDFSKNKNEPIGIFHSQHYNQANPINFNNNEEDDDMDTVIKIEEDDLLDERPQLRAIFKNDFFDKSECVCDVSQGSFTCKKGKFSKSLQRKLVNLHQLLNNHQLYQSEDDKTISEIQNLIKSTLANDDHNSDLSTSNPNNKSLVIYSIQNCDYKKKMFRLLRSIVERISIDALMLCDQYHNQLQNYEQIIQSSNTTSMTTNLNNPATKLWNEIKNRGCQFLGPQMQDDALRLILHALETVTRMSRKVLVLYVVHMLKKHYPKASKTSVSHVVQLLYRAGCFKMEKRINEASLMELKKEFSKYSALRRQHDAQIIQIALESGIRMSPEQWSQKLYGDATHKSEMQSIIDKLQSQQTLEKLLHDFYDKLFTTNSYANIPNQFNLAGVQQINKIFLDARPDFDYFVSINFEKRQVNIPNPNDHKRHSIVSSSNQTNESNTYLGSGGESLASEDESSFDNFDSININFMDDDDFDYNYMTSKPKLNKTSTSNSSTSQHQIEQTKIVWSLLNESLQRAIKLLSCHLEYTSKMLGIIISNNQNQNQLVSAANNTKLTNNLKQKDNNLNIKSTNSEKLIRPMGPNETNNFYQNRITSNIGNSNNSNKNLKYNNNNFITKSHLNKFNNNNSKYNNNHDLSNSTNNYNNFNNNDNFYNSSSNRAINNMSPVSALPGNSYNNPKRNNFNSSNYRNGSNNYFGFNTNAKNHENNDFHVKSFFFLFT